MMALKITLSVRAGIVVVQELFIGSWEISHSGFNFYWSKGGKKEIRVMRAVRKDLEDKIIVDQRANLIHQPHFMLFEIHKLDLCPKRLGHKTQVVNVYESQVRRGYTWDEGIPNIRRALENVD